MQRSLAALGLALLAAVSIPSAAVAGPEACREWRTEHAAWKAQVLRRTLLGAPQQVVDEAVFELLQREAWLTSCDEPVRVARAGRLGWRLVDRAPDEYATVLVESVLECAGFDLALDTWLDGTGPEVDATDRRTSDAR